MGTSARDLQALHDRRDPLVGEATHQIVFQREVETRLAGVALTARSASQLIVDAARFVPFRAEHVEAADLEDLLLLGLGLGLELLDRSAYTRLVLLAALFDAPLAHLGLGELLGVAAEHDVDTAAGHVGGNRHRTQLARPGR